MCSEFVTPQKNVLLATQPNLNDKKSSQVNKISYQNLEKISSSLCSQTLGACPLAALKPRPLAGKMTRVTHCRADDGTSCRRDGRMKAEAEEDSRLGPIHQ